MFDLFSEQSISEDGTRKICKQKSYKITLYFIKLSANVLERVKYDLLQKQSGLIDRNEEFF